MQIFSAILFVLSASTDNFVVGLCYGIKKIKINLPINLLIALISSIGTILSMELGNIIATFVPNNFTNILGGSILILIGLWAMLSEFNENKKSSKAVEKNSLSNIEDILSNPENADKDTSGSIDLKESFSLSIALALNNMGLGIGASIAGLNIILTTILTFFISIITISLGLTVGNKYLSQKLGKYAAVISGIIIILLGIYEMLAK
ncbi:sporulation membrane protein YtaF [Clostridium guangxiense]|uniref:sporulation membrane protein YtaF n=1 Tax=Clostridium guangxiense TaxID=1662055 RepID=UPI001E5A415C|nr:sporulation membrane protein YtaF [Clostridium guangxiense]MCD2348842.1 sporulation membrane protein YtaF [Clostridium guangxiense]